MLRQQQYWGGRATNDTLRDYVGYEFGFAARDAIVTAVHLLEGTYSIPKTLPYPDSNPVSATALALLDSAAATMTATALGSWRWRILYLRALVDATALNMSMHLPVRVPLNYSFAELDRIYHVERSCGGTCLESNTDDACINSTWFNCTGSILRPGMYFAGCQ